MPDFRDYEHEQTLAAAGLPTDVGRIIGRTLRYRRHRDQDGKQALIIGITFGIRSFSLRVVEEEMLIRNDGTVWYFLDDSGLAPSGWSARFLESLQEGESITIALS